jgi:hypothetical protein
MSADSGKAEYECSCQACGKSGVITLGNAHEWAKAKKLSEYKVVDEQSSKQYQT